MVIRNLTLKNFRNFESLELAFSPAQNLIMGPNGSGKSNILEALYLLASGLSRRAERDEEMVSWGADFAKIQARLGDTTNLDLTLSLSQSGQLTKVAQVNAVKKPMAHFLENFFAVEFSPSDLDLVSGPPEGRRRYLNGVLGQASPNYRLNLHSFDKARREKNNLLEKIRDGLSREDEVDIWNEQILSLGKEIQRERSQYLNFLSENKEGLNFEYRPSDLSPERLSQFRAREIAAGTSLIGPHRDDWSINKKHVTGNTEHGTRLSSSALPVARDLSSFGSRGEQRMAIFALKNRELDYFRMILKVEPLLLLDDIFSELDLSHRQAVFSQLRLGRSGQVIFTATDTESLLKSGLEAVKVLKL